MSDILDKIIEAKEKMGDNAIEKIVKHYNLENYNPERKSASCPFHTDKTPSLIWNDKDQAFKCFSCSRRIPYPYSSSVYCIGIILLIKSYDI